MNDFLEIQPKETKMWFYVCENCGKESDEQYCDDISCMEAWPDECPCCGHECFTNNQDWFNK